MNLFQELGWLVFRHPSTKNYCTKILDGFNTKWMRDSYLVEATIQNPDRNQYLPR